MRPPLVEKRTGQSRADSACSCELQVVPLAPLARQPSCADLGVDVLERFLAVNGPLCVRAEILETSDPVNVGVEPLPLSVPVPSGTHFSDTHGYRSNRQRSDES